MISGAILKTGHSRAERELVIGVRSRSESMDELSTWATLVDAGGGTPRPSELYFETVDAMLAALTPRRLQLVAHITNGGPVSIRALSRSIERDYKSVHTDISQLLDLGLIAKDDDGLIYVPWDSITAEIAIRKAA